MNQTFPEGTRSPIEAYPAFAANRDVQGVDARKYQGYADHNAVLRDSGIASFHVALGETSYCWIRSCPLSSERMQRGDHHEW